jgi:exodeoxyribonuclease VII small subunit
MIDTRDGRAEEQTSFEDALQKIREIVSALESGDLTLEESIANYKAGAHLIDQCRSLIADAELRVTELARGDEADQ